ncbi:MAG: HupE/UreJ family protein [Sphingobacteriales bacterium]|nr:MAG: HupE/UreJ family protein [Sphingobacteriales bacterium]
MKITKITLFLSAALLVPAAAWCHTSVTELEKMSRAQTAWIYLRLGFEHIVPLGLDHILFVLSLFLLSPKIKPVLQQSLAFTAAHSITLGLAMCGIIQAPPAVIEPLISLSIAVMALENIFRPTLRKSRILVVFFFGLVHGLGFASSLSTMGLPSGSFFSSLLAFNVGVEIGQLSVILLAFLLVGKWFGDKPAYRRLVVVPASAVIVIIAAVWTVQRLFV